MKIKYQLLLSKKPMRNNSKLFYFRYLMDSKNATGLFIVELLRVSLLY